MSSTFFKTIHEDRHIMKEILIAKSLIEKVTDSLPPVMMCFEEGWMFLNEAALSLKDNK